MVAPVASSGMLMNRFLLRNFGVVAMGRLAQELREDLAPYSQCCRLRRVPMERPTAFSQNSLSAVKRWTRWTAGRGAASIGAPVMCFVAGLVTYGFGFRSADYMHSIEDPSAKGLVPYGH